MVQNRRIRCHVNDFVVVPFGHQFAYAFVNGFHHQDHAGPTTELIVIDLAITVDGIVSQAMEDDFGQALVLGSFQYGIFKWAFDELWSHCSKDPSCRGMGHKMGCRIIVAKLT